MEKINRKAAPPGDSIIGGDGVAHSSVHKKPPVSFIHAGLTKARGRDQLRGEQLSRGESGTLS